MEELELEVVQAALRPGDTLAGLVRIAGAGDRWVQVTLQGEEVLSANSMAFNYVLPFFEVSTTLDCSQGPADFHFALPEQLPPTYFSQDLRCLYQLKARRKGAPGLLPGFRRDAIRRIQIPLLPAAVDPSQQQHWFVLKGGGVELEVRLDQVEVEPGASLTGELEVRRAGDGPLPRLLTFRFAAIEEVTQKGYFHRQVLSLQTQDIEPDSEMQLPYRGLFEFPVPNDAPTSGDWHTFRVHYGFRVGMTFPDGQAVRESLPILIQRYPEQAFPSPE